MKGAPAACPRLPAHARAGLPQKGAARRDDEFLFAETPVDEAAPPSSSAAAAQRLGCVAVTVFATRRVRVDDSSSDDEQGHSSSGAITATHLPEKQAVKEYGVQARALTLTLTPNLTLARALPLPLIRHAAVQGRRDQDQAGNLVRVRV